MTLSLMISVLVILSQVENFVLRTKNKIRKRNFQTSSTISSTSTAHMTGTDPRAVVTFIYKNTREEEEPRRRKNCRFTVAHCGSRVKNDSGSDADAPTPRTDKKFYNLSAQFYESRITKTQVSTTDSNCK